MERHLRQRSHVARREGRAEAARRRFRQDRENDDRPDHFLHRRAWRREHGRPAEARARGAEVADLLRSRVHLCAHHRAHRSERDAAGRGLPIRSRRAEHRRRARLRSEGARDEHEGLSAEHHPGHVPRRVHVGRSAAGALRVAAHGLCAARPRRTRAARAERGGLRDAGFLRDHAHRRARCTGGRVRRDGVHRRQLRDRLAGKIARADGWLLPHRRALHRHRARLDRACVRRVHFPPARLPEGRTAARARHEFLRDRAAGAHRKNAAPRLLAINGRRRGADGLQLQSRRHKHLHGDGRDLPRAGDEHAARSAPADRPAARRDDHLERRKRRDRRGLRDPRRHALRDEDNPHRVRRAAARH